MPEISIITPCYNSGKLILDAVESVKQQDFSDYEHIIIDDGSADVETLEILDRLAKDEKTIVMHQENTGPGVARNNAIDRSQSEFLVMLDADNKIRPQTIHLALKVMNDDPDAGVVYGDYEFFGLRTGLKKQSEFDLRKQFAWNYVEMATVMRKSCFLEAGGFDTYCSRHGIEDYELWFRVAQTRWKFRYIEHVLFDYRISSYSRTDDANAVLNKTLDYIYTKHAALLHRQYMEMYHENKNMKQTPDYRLGNKLLKIPRMIKKMF